MQGIAFGCENICVNNSTPNNSKIITLWKPNYEHIYYNINNIPHVCILITYMCLTHCLKIPPKRIRSLPASYSSYPILNQIYPHVDTQFSAYAHSTHRTHIINLYMKHCYTHRFLFEYVYIYIYCVLIHLLYVLSFCFRSSKQMNRCIMYIY